MAVSKDPVSAGPAPADLVGGSPSVELSSDRTGLAFERTRMGADRTLMANVRTSLSLISFGFTIYQVFNKAEAKGLLDAQDPTARGLGLALLVLGLLFLVTGITTHARFGRVLTERRRRLFGLQLLRSDISYIATPTFALALLLLLVGVAALSSIVFRIFG